MTRNAVIGKVPRLGLSGRAKSPAAAAPRQRKPRPAQHMMRGKEIAVERAQWLYFCKGTLRLDVDHEFANGKSRVVGYNDTVRLAAVEGEKCVKCGGPVILRRGMGRRGADNRLLCQSQCEARPRKGIKVGWSHNAPSVKPPEPVKLPEPAQSVVQAEAPQKMILPTLTHVGHKPPEQPRNGVLWWDHKALFEFQRGQWHKIPLPKPDAKEAPDAEPMDPLDVMGMSDLLESMRINLVQKPTTPVRLGVTNRRIAARTIHRVIPMARGVSINQIERQLERARDDVAKVVKSYGVTQHQEFIALLNWRNHLQEVLQNRSRERGPAG